MVRLLFNGDVGAERRRWVEYTLNELLRLAGVLVPGKELTVGYGTQGSIGIEPSPAVDPAGVHLRLVGNPTGSPGWPEELYALFPPSTSRPPGITLYEDDSGRALITIENDLLRLAVDPLATAWYLLTQEEERRHPDRRDEHGRLCLSKTALPPKIFERPWLEAWGRFFAKSLAGLGPVIRYGRHPEGAAWSVVLTHDVDSISERSPGRALRLLAGGVFRLSEAHFRAAGRMFRLLARPDRHRCLTRCVEADTPAKATYLFHAGRRGRWDPEYDLFRLRDEVESLIETGQEVGIHYGYETAGNLSRLTEELAEFEKAAGFPPKGGRAHYLRLRGPDDLDNVAQTGLVYDCSLGFTDGPGYRSACGGPYRTWDEENEGPSTLFELPLVVMDGALFKRYGEGEVDVEDAWNRVRPYLDAAREEGAAICLLWHQRVF
ncbi:hypothetical protein KAU45_01050, partial [bacterium]|nr:hypothetical protein [bacterium]